LAGEARSSLLVNAPKDAVVLSKHPEALLGQNVGSGRALLDLADAGPRMVRVYIPASVLDRISPSMEVALALPGSFAIVRLPLAPPGEDVVSLPQGLVHSQQYKGVKMPVFYCSGMKLPASADNQPFGIGGEAKIFGKRRSLAQHVATSLYNLAKAHLL
jgi:hypothetical protein